VSMDNQDLCEQLYRHLSEFLDREMTEELRAKFETHLAECVSCRSLCKTMQGTVDMVRDLGTSGVPCDCLARLRRRVMRGSDPTEA
jgi:predicted anti-sigma-YlaC factor YlaD